MSYQSSYFFPPSAKPLNANLPAGVEKWLDVFGRANAAEFSRRGWPFFVAEYFDLFYPGYGDSWPSLRGAIGMTYEMAGGGRAGSVVERTDGTVLTLSDRALRHYVTSIETLRTAAANREALLRHTYDAAKTQLASANQTFLILRDSPNFDDLVSLLQRQGIRVEMLATPATIRATPLTGTAATQQQSFAVGTAVVTTRQPLGALARTLLEKSAVLGKPFVEEQRMRTEADQPDQFYDVTTWSLPVAMNVEAWSTTAQVNATPFRRQAAPEFRAASYGYLVDGLDPKLYRFLGSLLRTDVRFSVAESELTIEDRTFSRGTLVILKGNNADNLDQTLAAIVQESGANVVPLASGWSGGTASARTAFAS